MAKRYAESAFTEWFCRCVERVNGYTLAFVGHTMQTSGIPDRYICHKNWRGWVEFKRDERVVRTNQRVVMQSLLDRGDHVLVVRALDGGDDFAIERVPGVGRWCGEELLRVNALAIKAEEVEHNKPPGLALVAALADAWARYEMALVKQNLRL